MAKKSLFDDADSDAASNVDEAIPKKDLKINEEYARRFEHNKKREERQRLEEKYKAQGGRGGEDEDSESSEDETEDEDGFLATEELDAEISATLQAIKKKDPRIYDKDAKFFHSLDENAPAVPKDKKEKPMFLHDYHRQRYMAGDTGVEEDAAPKTFVQEQADLKENILAEINAAAGGASDDEDGFIKAKPGSKAMAAAAASAEPAAEQGDGSGMHPSRLEQLEPKKKSKSKSKGKEIDLSLADRDPELYLSNFMASRAWAENEGSNWQAFESDDGEGNDDADEWETAYNLRFEDPAKSNEVLMSYSRKVVDARSVRREEPKGRKRARELEKERKEEERRQRHEERARLKRLKLEEAEEKLAKIKKAAGLRGKALKDEEWMALLEGSWEDDKWEEEMKKRFGEEYYAEAEVGSDSEDDEDGGAKSSKKKPKKPKWDDDIDIKDIIPDFEDEEAKPNITLTDDEAENDDDDDDDDEQPTKKRKNSKSHKAERVAAKRTARQERAKLEAIVDTQLELNDPTALKKNKTKASSPSSGSGSGFRYRETSPQSFGLTSRDILLAPTDSALNEFAGLKKLATFRDAEKKRKDRKRLGKKARLREWRRDVFGREYEHSGPTFGFGGERDAGADGRVANKGETLLEEGEKKKKKRKRSKGTKGASAAI